MENEKATPRTLDLFSSVGKKSKKYRSIRISGTLKHLCIGVGNNDKVYTNVDPVLRQAVEKLPVNNWLIHQ